MNGVRDVYIIKMVIETYLYASGCYLEISMMC